MEVVGAGERGSRQQVETLSEGEFIIPDIDILLAPSILICVLTDVSMFVCPHVAFMGPTCPHDCKCKMWIWMAEKRELVFVK